MTLGDIRLEALRLMYVNGDSDIRAQDLSQLADTDTYGVYLVNMWGAVNRCFCDLENKGALPSRLLVLNKADAERCAFGGRLRFTPATLRSDFLAADRLVYENSEGEYDPDAPYKIEGEHIIIPDFDSDSEEYRLYYHPRIARIFPYTADTAEIDIPDNIAAYIPYFIKSELYAEEEPGEAVEARNIYESGVLTAIKSVSRQARVQSRYTL